MDNKELFEKMKREGEEWHDYKINSISGSSCSCGLKGFSVRSICANANPNFSTPAGFFWLWERVLEKEWWIEFLVWSEKKRGREMDIRFAEHFGLSSIDIYYIHRTVFRDALKKYLKGEEE